MSEESDDPAVVIVESSENVHRSRNVPLCNTVCLLHVHDINVHGNGLCPGL